MAQLKNERLASTALDVEGSKPVEVVQLDSLVALKILKHSRENYPSPVTGSLLGLDVNGTLEVSNCFPFPSSYSNDDADGRIPYCNSQNEYLTDNPFLGEQYQLDMMRCLRDVNVDNNSVGWYQSTYRGAFMNQSLIERQYNYQVSFGNKSVVIIHDVDRASQGNASLRAFRLSESFMEAYKEKKFTSEILSQLKLSYENILEELPVAIRNSNLVNAMLYEMEDVDTIPTNSFNPEYLKEFTDKIAPLTPNFDVLELSLNPFVEKNLECLIDSIEEHASEQGNFQYWQRSVAREQAKIQQHLSKRKAENASRVAAGQKPLPEEDINTLFKLPQEPSRLESMLITSQISEYCKQVNQFSGPALGKLFSAGELQK
ncbi:hypothetical protein K493DRAFT_335102 [Basidiobolus meristosporus CBS 931.73]|uniref:Eukaryotic translation initiation factor 3 subunit H n=1 Tax=Basidiobolus meristosporus CBS 931.73 TaxID=1314790 RepID=A0A1Y1YT10_9FUNG|nr:hypothetical protein K493DRAFT_335102 [Basidiobolus meristosporus CBS 931.73]|eukprot:ORY01099.1 hypothetical protein K493DRAFT_335102 [Basidiobolus meristosporus CBS 931.73]